MSGFSYHLNAPDPAPLGLIVLQADETIEHDMRRLLGGHAPYVSRVPSGLEVSRESLSQMADHLTQAASLFPKTKRFQAIGYGCTSGAAQIGADRVASLIQDGARCQNVSEPVSALIAACDALNVKRLAFLSPYVEEVSQHLRQILEQAEIETPIFGSFDEACEEKVVRIDQESIIQAAVELCNQQSIDALFLSCTNLRTLDVIAPLEEILGIPVLSSNLVLAWHMAQLGGVEMTSIGRLGGGVRHAHLTTS